MEFGAITRHGVYDRNWFPFEKLKLCNARFSCYCRNFFESVLCCCFFFSKLIVAINGIRRVAIEEKFTQLESWFGLVLQLFFDWGQFFSEELVLEPPEMTHYKNHSNVLDHIILKPFVCGVCKHVFVVRGLSVFQ